MEKIFNDLMILLNNSSKETELRAMFNNSTTLRKLELIAIVRDYLGIKETDLMKKFKADVLNLQN